jgi:hypothetical protein
MEKILRVACWLAELVFLVLHIAVNIGMGSYNAESNKQIGQPTSITEFKVSQTLIYCVLL